MVVAPVQIGLPVLFFQFFVLHVIAVLLSFPSGIGFPLCWCPNVVITVRGIIIPGVYRTPYEAGGAQYPDHSNSSQADEISHRSVPCN